MVSSIHYILTEYLSRQVEHLILKYVHFSRQLFGEGLYWAGCAFVVLLNQQKRFEALDFCSHIVKVYDVDPRDETVGGVVSFLEIFSHSSGFY
jgi:hypothetical protein